MLLDLFNKKKRYRCLTKCILPPHVYSADNLNCKCHSWYVFFFSNEYLHCFHSYICNFFPHLVRSTLSDTLVIPWTHITLCNSFFFQKHHFCTKLKKPFTADVLIRVLFWMRTIWSLCVTEWKWKVHREVLFLSFRGAASYEHFGVEWFYFVILCFEGQGRDLPLTRVWNDP